MNVNLLLLALIALVTLAFYFLLRNSRRDALEAERYRKNVYKLSRALIEDRQMVPDSIAEVAYWMARTVLSGKFARDLFWELLTGRLNSYADKEPSGQWMEALKSMPDEHRHQFFELCVNYVFATSYKSVLLGPALRRVIVHIVKNAASSEAIVLDEYEDSKFGQKLPAAA